MSLARLRLTPKPPKAKKMFRWQILEVVASVSHWVNLKPQWTKLLRPVNPDHIVETTGVAEPDALVFDIQESRTRWLDGVVTVADADAMKYPQVGHTARMQIESADIILLNKVDLVSGSELRLLQKRLNRIAFTIRTVRCQIDPDLLFWYWSRTDSITSRSQAST